MMRRQLRGIGAILAAVAGLVLLPVAAWAQAGQLDLSVRDTRMAADGQTEIVVNVTGDAVPSVLGSEAFTVAEQGESVEIDVTPLLSSGAVRVAVGLTIDASGSMRGEPMDLTKAAAVALVEELTQQGVLIQVVSFASEIEVLTPLTADAPVLVEAIESIVPGGATRLYDGLLATAQELAKFEGQRNLLLFSDGGDTESEAGRIDAITAAGTADAPVVTVALETDDIDAQALEAIAAGTEGRLLTAQDASEIGSLFELVASDLASQYLLTYQGQPVELTDIELSVAVDSGGTTDEVAYSVPNTRDLPPVEAQAPRVIDGGGPGLFARQEMLYVGLGAAFVALLVIFGMMLMARKTQADRVLSDQLASYIEGKDARAGRSSDTAAYFRARALALLEATPRPKGLDAALTIRLEQAAWLMRPGEFVALCVLATLAVGLVVGIVFHPLGGLLLGLLAGFVPVAILSMRRSKRQDAFLQALPDTLQLMAGSLRAGYGVLQSIDTVAKEGAEPVAGEFNRVLTEARLGMPLEDALQDTADRIGSEDFRWVVLAINIQREVGGNLAELLDLVSAVLREREMLRRQIKVLSAEGRLSALVLIVLPIFLAVYMILVRPEYVGTLVTSGLIGWTMVIGAGVLMLGGIFWIKRLVKIEV